MRWTCRHEKFSRLDSWTGRKNNIKFEINETYEGDYYILSPNHILLILALFPSQS